MKKTKKNIVIVQIVLSNIIFVIACYYLQKNIFFDGNKGLVFVAYLLIIFMFVLSNFIYFRNYKTINEEKKSE